MRTLTLLVLVVLSSTFLSACVTSNPVKKKAPQEKIDPVKGTGNAEAAKKRLGLAMRYLELGRIPQAKRNLDKALEHVPGLAGGLIGYGYYYQLVNEHEKAEDFYKKGLAKEPNNPHFLNTYGVFLCATKRYSEAQNVFEKAVADRSYTNVAETYENMGMCAFDAKEFVKAERNFSKALAYNPNMPKSLLELAHLAFNKGQYIRSQAYLKQYDTMRNPTPRSMWLSLRVESKLGNKDEAASIGLRLERLYPTAEETLQYLETKSQW